MSSSPRRICRHCGNHVPVDAPAGLCPTCLAKAAFDTEPASKEARVVPDIKELEAEFPQFEKFELIGIGGMGAVYKARQIHLDRVVALKILRVEAEKDPSFAERFSREAKALARLNHPGIVALYEYGKTDRYCFLVMEYVDGMNLRQLIKAQSIAPDEALALVIQVCSALQFAHDEGIVHRDIKPENILINRQGQAKIADFGLVKLLDASTDVTLTGNQSFMGTVYYMAPEQREKPLEVDHRADIYSLGVVLYELLTGELPIGRFAPPSRKVQINVHLDEVVLRALEKEPDLRFQKASEVKTAIECVPTKDTQNTKNPGQSHRATCLVASAISVLAIAGCWWLFGSKLRRGNVAESNHGNPARDGSTQTVPVSEINPVPSGLIGWWKADGNGADSAGTNNAMLVEGAGFDAGVEGQAFYFNHESAYVTIPRAAQWNFGDHDFSIALWAKFLFVSDLQALMACEKGNGKVTKWLLAVRKGLFQWQMCDGTNQFWLGTGSFKPEADRWYHLAVTRAGDTFSFFIDGVEVSNDKWSGPVPVPSQPLNLGNAWGGYPLKGVLDDVRIYNRALTAEDVKKLSQPRAKPALERELVQIGDRTYQRTEFVLNTGETSDNMVNVAELVSGNFVAMWQQGLVWHCYGKMFNPEGDPLGAMFVLNTDAMDRFQWGPCPAALPNGGFVTAWGEQMKSKNNGSNARRFNAAGVPLGESATLDLPDWTASASFTNGDVVFAGIWILDPKSTNDFPVLARRFNSSGIPYGPTFRVNAAINGYATVSASYGSDGRFAFGWASRSSNAMVRAFRSDEFSPFGVEFAANAHSLRRGVVKVRYNSNNELLVAWPGVLANRSTMFLRKFDSNLVAMTPEIKVSEKSAVHWWNADFSIGRSGDALICWDSGPNIYGRLLDENGTPLGHEFRVNRSDKGTHSLGWAASSHCAVLRDGSFVVGWGGSDGTGKCVNLTVFKRMEVPPYADLH